MNEFFQAIPAAAKSPLALAAYAIAAILMAYGGFQFRQLRVVMRTIREMNKRQTIDDKTLIDVVGQVTGSPVPPSLTGAQWLVYARQRARTMVSIALLIAIFVVAVLALLQRGRGKDDGVTMIDQEIAGRLCRLDYALEEGAQQGWTSEAKTLYLVLWLPDQQSGLYPEYAQSSLQGLIGKLRETAANADKGALATAFEAAGTVTGARASARDNAGNQYTGEQAQSVYNIIKSTDALDRLRLPRWTRLAEYRQCPKW